MKPLMVIGDVHGAYAQLSALLESRHTSGRQVVFVGDLVDRGPDSAKVLRLVTDFIDSWPPGAILLRGNHEQALLDFLEMGKVEPFLRNGGLATVASYYKSVPPNVLRSFRQDFPGRQLAALRNSHLYMETDDLLISHMGFDPQRPSARDVDAMVLNPHHKMFDLAPKDHLKLTICGHYLQRNREPYITDKLVCIDTGCGTIPGAPLTAILLPERRALKTDVRGGIV
jgi:serine/threonine protein phosphatase 1